jgi:hypothetical protein
VQALIAKGKSLLHSDEPESRVLGADILSRCGRAGYVAHVADQLRAAYEKETVAKARRRTLVAMSFFYLDAHVFVVPTEKEVFLTPDSIYAALMSEDPVVQAAMEACLYIYFVRRSLITRESNTITTGGSLNGAGVADSAYSARIVGYCLQDAPQRQTIEVRRMIQALRHVPRLGKHLEERNLNVRFSEEDVTYLAEHGVPADALKALSRTGEEASQKKETAPKEDAENDKN